MSIISFLISLSSYAIYDPDWMKPILSAKMEIVHATGTFQNIDQVELTLSKHTSGKQADQLTLSYVEAPECIQEMGDECLPVIRNVTVSIKEEIDLGCGSKEYHASLNDVNDPTYGGRFTIILQDHMGRTCENAPAPYLWQASIRKGYGWCGTMDSKLEIVGNPAPVYTIQ